MAEKSYLINGRFLHNLNGWTVSDPAVVYSAGDADEHYGVCILPTGNMSIEQAFGVVGIREFTLRLAVKAVGGSLSGGQAILSIEDGEGNTVLTQNLTGVADTWTINEFEYGLGEGTTYTLRIKNVSAIGNVKIDDVWLWFVPMTRGEIATRVHAKLGRLVAERNMYPNESGALTEGAYTYAVDAALRYVGAIDPDAGLPDVRWLDEQTIQNALDYVEKQMLEQLQKDYAVEVDTSEGPYSQSLSQKRQAISDMLGDGGSGGSGGSAGGVVIERRMTYD